MNTKTVSFRTQLKGTLSDFLKKEDMCCPQTEDGLLELVVALSHYTEEGHPLFPQVVLCDNLDTTLSLLQGSDALTIGLGPRDQSTISFALKRCAPLARGGWVIYIQRLLSAISTICPAFCSRISFLTSLFLTSLSVKFSALTMPIHRVAIFSSINLRSMTSSPGRHSSK